MASNGKNSDKFPFNSRNAGQSCKELSDCKGNLLCCKDNWICESECKRAKFGQDCTGKYKCGVSMECRSGICYYQNQKMPQLKNKGETCQFGAIVKPQQKGFVVTQNTKKPNECNYFIGLLCCSGTCNHRTSSQCQSLIPTKLSQSLRDDTPVLNQVQGQNKEINSGEVGLLAAVSVALFLVLIFSIVYFIRKRKMENYPQPDMTVQMATQITIPDDQLKDISTMQVIPQMDQTANLPADQSAVIEEVVEQQNKSITDQQQYISIQEYQTNEKVQISPNEEINDNEAVEAEAQHNQP